VKRETFIRFEIKYNLRERFIRFEANIVIYKINGDKIK
jgi:hypothetical protein